MDSVLPSLYSGNLFVFDILTSIFQKKRGVGDSAKSDQREAFAASNAADQKRAQYIYLNTKYKI